MRMNNGWGKCGPQKMMRPWEKMFLRGKMAQGMILARGEGDP